MEHNRPLRRTWVLPLAAGVLIVTHAILFYGLRHTTVSGNMVSGALLVGFVALLVAKHLGLLVGLRRALQVFFRRRSQR
jgi:hypothetical protein